MFLTACCHACNPSNHLLRFHSSDEPPEFAPKMLSELSFIIPNAASIILDREKGRKRRGKQKKNLRKTKTTPNHRDADLHRTNIITWPRCLVKYGNHNTGLWFQTSSAIITNYWRSPGYTSPVWKGLLSIGKKLHSINTQTVFDTCYNILDIVVKWPGSTHNSRILIESGFMQIFEQMPLLLAIHSYIKTLSPI